MQKRSAERTNMDEFAKEMEWALNTVDTLYDVPKFRTK